MGPALSYICLTYHLLWPYYLLWLYYILWPYYLLRQVPSGGVVTGIGSVHGRLCMIVANDATVHYLVHCVVHYVVNYIVHYTVHDRGQRRHGALRHLRLTMALLLTIAP